MNIRCIVLFVLLNSLVATAADELQVKNGQTVSEVIAILGEPDGTVAKGKDSYLYYAGMTIKITSGVVSDLPKDFNEILKASREKKSERDRFVRDQEITGLVCYNGTWMTKDEKEYATEKDRVSRLLIAREKQLKLERQKTADWIKEQNKYGPTVEFVVHRKDGTKADHRPLAIPGKVALVVFSEESEQMCAPVLQYLQKLAQSDPYLVVKSINFSSQDDPIVEQFGVTGTSIVRVIDQQGRVMTKAINAPSQKNIAEDIEQAKRQCGLGKYAKP